ncbi:hypothetical protein V2J09_011402, partial [Rumex salicifolius]
SVPLFLSEIAPIKYRGAVNILFQLLVTVGILIANLVNYATSGIHPNGWRYSLGGAIVPAFLLFIGGFIITETPTSLVEHDKVDEGRAALRRIRGVDDVEAELQQVVEACTQAKLVKSPFNKLRKKQSLPPLAIGMLMQVFQQMTGINAIMFYAPFLFQTVGYRSGGALISAVIIGVVNVLSTLVSIYFVNKMIIGILLIVKLQDTNTLARVPAGVVVAFAWSWGPLGWLIPSETFPLETRTAGFAFAVSTNMLFTFFIFFSAWIVVMALFVVFLLPETKGVPIDMVVERVWRPHRVWRKFVGAAQDPQV